MLLGRCAVALAVAVPVVLGGLVGVNVYIDRKIDDIPRVKLKTATDTDPGNPANFLLIGSDTLMVIHVDPRRRSGFLVSFPRDLAVDIPGMGMQKINAAFNQGPQKVIDTLKQDFNIDIHHYLEVDFESFKGIVDAMGGVPVYLPAPAQDPKSGFEFVPFGFHPGCYNLDGGNALGYVRSRDMQQLIDGDWRFVDRDAPDLHRIERQQTFLRRLAVEAFHRSVNNPLAANRIADETVPKLKADDSLDRSDINKLIRSFRKVDPNDPNSLQMVTLPTVAGPTTKALGQIQVLNEPDADLVLAGLRDFGPPPQPQGPKPAEIRVRVFNGSGASGTATNASSDLQKRGFVAAGVGNHARVSVTEVRYRPGSQEKARVVAGYLGGVGRLVEDPTIVEADVLVVVGKDFKAVTAPNAMQPSDTSAAPAPTAAAPATAVPKGSPAKPSRPPADPTQC